MMSSPWCAVIDASWLPGSEQWGWGMAGLSTDRDVQTWTEPSVHWPSEAPGQNAARLQPRSLAAPGPLPTSRRPPHLQVQFDVGKVFTSTRLRWRSCCFDGDALAGETRLWLSFLQLLVHIKVEVGGGVMEGGLREDVCAFHRHWGALSGEPPASRPQAAAALTIKRLRHTKLYAA